MMVIIEASVPLEGGCMTGKRAENVPEDVSPDAAIFVDGYVSIAASRGGASGDSRTFF